MSGFTERLAARLFRKSEHLDPTSDGDSEAEDGGWSKLSERKRDFWRLLVEDQLHEMRVPTFEMLTVGEAWNSSADRIWRAMIDEGLK